MSVRPPGSMTPLPTTREGWVRLARQLGFRPQRQSGQHFLLDPRVVHDLVAAVAPAAGELVLEIGPGFGVITEALIATGARVTAIELDRRLAAFLTQRLGERARVITGDVFAQRLPDLFTDRGYVLASNLPYNITSLVIRNFLTLRPRPHRLALVLQQEVAERLTAPPGRTSLLSLGAQLYSDVQVLREVASEAFWPPPDVTSALVRFDLKPDDALPPDPEAIFRLARISFSARRKTLLHNVSSGLKRERQEVAQALERVGCTPLARAQELSLEQWQELANILFDFEVRK